MRVVELSMTLLLLLLASPRHADGYALSMDDGEAAYDLEEMDSNNSSTDDNTAATSATSITPCTTTDTTDTTDTPCTTDTTILSSSSTEIESTTTSKTTSLMTTTTTTITTTSEPTTTSTSSSSSTSPPPPPGLSLLEETLDELSKITDTLDDFKTLVDSASAPSPAASAPAGGRGGHPVGWWELGSQTRPLVDVIGYFCVNESSKIDLCTSLYDELKTIDASIEILKTNVDHWTESEQEKLKSERQDLDSTYHDARDDRVAFTESINKTTFGSQISQVQKDVQTATQSVEDKIAVLTQDSGSVILVAVIGSFGCLMVVAILSVMVYGAVKRVKTKKKLSSAPYNKLQGENIPIDGFLSDGPGSRNASRMDPYSHPVPSSVQRDPYAAPYVSRSESKYSGPTVIRQGQGLPRTQF